MFGSLITQPLRIATRGARIGARITLRGAHEAVEIAEGLVALIAARLVGGDSHHNGNGEAAEPAAWQGPAASSTSSPADTAAPTRSGTLSRYASASLTRRSRTLVVPGRFLIASW